MEQKKKVKLYTTSTCPYCKNTKAFLDEKGVAYENYDVGTDEAKRNEMIEKSGQMGVPVIDIENTIIIGFDKEGITKALGL